MEERVAHFREFAPEELTDEDLLALINTHGGREVKAQANPTSNLPIALTPNHHRRLTYQGGDPERAHIVVGRRPLGLQR